MTEFEVTIELILALGGLVAGAVVWLFARIETKSKNIGERIGKTESENAELSKEIVALKTENKNLQSRVAKAEERDERWVCKNDLKELKASINTRFDKLETAIKESKQ